MNHVYEVELAVKYTRCTAPLEETYNVVANGNADVAVRKAIRHAKSQSFYNRGNLCKAIRATLISVKRGEQIHVR